jgi:hypothetical protein
MQSAALPLTVDLGGPAFKGSKGAESVCFPEWAIVFDTIGPVSATWLTPINASRIGRGSLLRDQMPEPGDR